MNDTDGYRLEAALAFGAVIDDDAEQYTFTTSQLIAFAKSCECVGLSASLQLDRPAVEAAVAAHAAELTPIVDAEETKFMTARGYIAAPTNDPRKWVKPCSYCGPGKSTGLPGNACENCMNTGFES